MLFRDKEIILDENNELIHIKRVVELIEEHEKQLPNLNKLKKMYDQPVTSDIKVNLAKQITDLSVSYFMGMPISYTNGNIDLLSEWFTEIDEDSHNFELAKDQSIFGKAYELLYIDTVDDTEAVMTYLAELSPLNTFIVKDTSIKHNVILGVYYTSGVDKDGKNSGYTVNIYTPSYIYVAKSKELDKLAIETIEPHFFKEVPILEVLNNREEKGDYSDVVGLIEAYNQLQSNRIEDKNQFINRLLIIFNSSLGDDDKEFKKNKEILRQGGILELSSSGDGDKTDAKFISQSLVEADVEILRKSLSNDIHTIAKIPSMTDESFGGNISGIAMKYKLFNTEGLAGIKERQFKKMLRQRFRLINNVMSLKGYTLDLSAISIDMVRNLPVGLDEKLQELQGTQGLLSLRTRLLRYDAEIDVDAELEQLNKEKEQEAEIMSKAYSNYNFSQEDSNPDIDSDENSNPNVDKNE